MSRAAPMSNSQAVLTTVAEIAASQLPLSEGMRAAASESSGSVARGLRRLADQLDSGRTLEQACLDPDLRLPEYLRGMVLAAARTGQLGIALDELLDHQSSVRAMFWKTWTAIAYPAVVLGLNFILITFLLCWVVPVFKSMFVDFDIRLPAMTMAIVAISDLAIWVLLGPGRNGLIVLSVLSAVLIYLAASGRGGSTLQRLVIEPMPILGVLWQWSGASVFFHLLGALMAKDVPLTEALRLTADGVKKADLRSSGRWLADEVAGGRSLADAIEKTGCLPLSSVPLLRWGERTNSMPEAAHSLSMMFAERVNMRVDWLRSVAPPFVYVVVGLTAVATIVSLFLPMISLIQSLS